MLNLVKIKLICERSEHYLINPVWPTNICHIYFMCKFVADARLIASSLASLRLSAKK